MIDIQLLQQVAALDIDEQIELVETIWDNIVNHNTVPELTLNQKAELERRLENYLENPENVLSWHEVKTTALDKIGQ